MAATPSIGILKMPAGNLRSVSNAVYENGFDPLLVDETDDFNSLTHLIVPGVGNFRAVMTHLNQVGLAERILGFASSGRPLLGICAGMQLLAERGTESAETPGLGLIAGAIDRLPEQERLPHVGWSEVELCFDHPVVAGVKRGRDFYFVHSYALQDGDRGQWLGVSNYGAQFAAIVAQDNVVGFQFHPEKSQANGLRLIENFCNWDGRC